MNRNTSLPSPPSPPSRETLGSIQQARVKKWVEGRGYGFLENPDRSGPDIFIHFTDIYPVAGQRITSLHPGERVEFELGQGVKGPKAINVRVIQS